MANFKANSAVQAMIDAGVLSADLVKVTVDTLQLDSKATKQWLKLADTYRAKGITAAMIATEAKGGNTKLRSAVRAVCVQSLPEADRLLLQKEGIESKSPEQIARDAVSRDVGRRLARIESHLKKAEDKATGKEPSAPKTKAQLIADALDKVIGWLTGDDDGSLTFDIPKATKEARALKTMVSK